MSLAVSSRELKTRPGLRDILFGALTGACLLVACVWPLAEGSVANAASVRPVAAGKGMVVSAQHLATEVGVDILKRGGSAIDAAVAVGYALAVVYPAAGNLGGGGFMTVWFADGRKTFLDFREKAPRAATRDMYLDKDGNVIKGLTTTGWLAVGVPGTVSGLEYARHRYGTMTRASLIEPAIKLAENGFILDQGDVDKLAAATEDFRKFPATAQIFLNKGQPFVAGQRLVQPDLAGTLRLIGKHGADGFYKGETGAAIVKASRAGGGIIDQEDLDSYRTRELAPIECDYRGYHVISAPPPSSGGVAVCEMLNILEGYPLRELGWGSAQALHYEIEAMRHAYADRSGLGDPDFAAIPVQKLIDKSYATKIRNTIKPDKAGISADIRQGVAPHEGSNTTHFSIIDDAGNAVSMTVTLNDEFGAKVVASGTGVLMNDEMDDFTPNPGAANGYGSVQGQANAIVPGKTPRSSMTPSILTRDGKPVLILGTPGGSRIITTVLQTILNVVDFQMDIQEAVDAPRIHNQWLPEVTHTEPYALSPDTGKALESMGHRFENSEPTNHVAAILVGAPKLGGKPVGRNRLFGANDPRDGTGQALGY
ncbi:gamma-glutamyltransferase [Afipia sp. GAS231]|uniref:gamma-glutamyltransferase n=1 Tax=Afipia sp. GAS231 TaxID=1882747 RepID=UPI00087A87D5|nr:gamma-glutamyltransferase [Afipia sp. GAS231]SDN80316.1 gamma-glutamyltransferase 1 Threonine peptidase. MEROPS family T03 [Afipia sp. GAS231]